MLPLNTYYVHGLSMNYLKLYSDAEECSYRSHFMDEEMKAQKIEVPSLRSQSNWQVRALNLSNLSQKAHALNMLVFILCWL